MDTNLLQVIVLLALLPAAAADRKPRCYRSHELDEAANRKLQFHFRQPAERAAAGAGNSSCPLDLYAHLQHDRDYSRRSLSPWRLQTVALPDHYPPSYVAATCLCAGCIQFRCDGTIFQNFDFDSVAVTQSRVFLRRRLCDDGRSYELVPVSVAVPVACTCVRP